MKIFSDLIDTLGKVGSGLSAISNIPKAERDKYRQTMDETYRLIDTTLNMVIVRLGDILHILDTTVFFSEVMQLDNFDDWYQTERQFRLCAALRAAVAETQTLRSQLLGELSVNDWDSLLQHMEQILATESSVAGFLSERFRELAEAARNSADITGQTDIRQQVQSFRNALIAEREKLIKQEIELYAIV